MVQQRDELKEKHKELISEVKQKASFKHLLLEKKLDAVAEQLEARDAQLDDALSRANVDVSRLSKEAAAQRARAKDIIGRKDAELASINDETSRIVAAHQDLMDAVAQKMTDLGVPTCVEINQCIRCTKSFLSDGVAVLARSSGEESASPRHRAGVASMAWRTTR